MDPQAVKRFRVHHVYVCSYMSNLTEGRTFTKNIFTFL
ncbi:hypothetical protein HMPREF9412_0345 [Paenibacillus sp. HGF5]|nr:hypothetical protein HMPREF9412_0345 [Paenibacillus sp. HGF5]